MMKLLVEKRVELGRIDMDLETAESLQEMTKRNTKVLEDIFSSGEDQHGNIF